jgi:hypothetical protein
MIFRLSNKLNTRLGAGTPKTVPLHEDPLADWSADLFVAGRKDFILVSNTKSLYSTVLSGKAITNDTDFLTRSLSSLRELLERDGLELVCQHFTTVAESVEFARALNRSVTGSMNELKATATSRLADGDLALPAVSTKLNDILLTTLAWSGSGGYGRPREAFRLLLQGREA